MPTDSTVVVVTFSATSAGDSLEMLYRVRLFADEMRQAGLAVIVDGQLTVTVRPPARSHKAKPAPDDDDGLAEILPSRSALT